MPKPHTYLGQGILPTRSNHTPLHCFVAKKTATDEKKRKKKIRKELKENKFKRKELAILEVLTVLTSFNSIRIQFNSIESSPVPFNPVQPNSSCTLDPSAPFFIPPSSSPPSHLHLPLISVDLHNTHTHTADTTNLLLLFLLLLLGMESGMYGS